MVDRRPVLAAVGIALGTGLLGGAYALHRRTAPGAWPVAPPPSLAPSIEEAGKRFPQLRKLVDDPKVGSVVKEFAEAYSAGGVERAKAFARERGFMNATDDVTLTLLTENDETEALEKELEAEKAQIVRRGDRQLDVLIPWSVIEAEARSGRPPEQLLNRLSALGNVRGVLPAQKNDSPQQQRTGAAGGSEGVGSTGASRWHAAGFRGAGVKIGILDPEVSKAPRYLGDVLPRDTQVYTGGCVSPSGASLDDEGLHGVAAAEIVHEMAPDAQLYLACSLGDDDRAVQWLQQQGVRIISYSAGGTYGPRNGTGRTQSRINKVTAAGILWVNSAGNDGKTFHRGQLAGEVGWHTFAPGKTAMGFKTKSVDGTVRLTLLWNQFSNALVSDYDLYVFDSRMNEVARSANRNTVLRDPTETLSLRLTPGASYFVGVRGNSGVKGAGFVLNVHNASTVEFNTPSGSLAQPADATGALAVGAVVWNTNTLAPYSGRGPTEDGRLKPEISGPTEMTSRVYKGSFAGTSASAPHVAGAAGLVWARFPQYTRDQVVAFLTSRARDIGAPGPDNDTGAGQLAMGEPGAVAAAPPVTTSRPIAVAPPSTATAPATATATPGVGVSGGDDDDGSLRSAVTSVLLLASVGGFVLVGGIVALAVSLLRGGSRPAPALAAGPMAGPPAGWGAPPPPAPRGGSRGRQPPPVHVPTPPPAFAPTPPPAFAPAPPAGRLPSPPPRGPSGSPPVARASSPSHSAVVPASFGPGATVMPEAGQWTASLAVIAGPGLGQQVKLGPGVISVGRSPGNGLVIPDTTVSSRHAFLETDHEGCWVRDAGSVNGTFVNGQRVQRHFLRPGDVVAIGPARMRFDVTG